MDLGPWLSVLSAFASYLWAIVAFPFKVLFWVLISLLSGPVLAVLSPFIYIGSYILWSIQVVLGFFISLEPLYVFVSCGAIVGGFAGCFLGLTSGLITASLGIRDDDTGRANTPSDYYDSSAAPSPTPLTPSMHPFGAKTDDLFPDSDASSWQPIEPLAMGDSRSKPRGTRRAPGLVGQTIHEEQSDGCSTEI